MSMIRVALCSAIGLAVIGRSASAFAVDCFVDSQGGDDTKDGLSEATAVKSQAKIPTSCTVAKYKRGSVFNEAVKVGSKITTYTNYGDLNDPLPKFVKTRSPNNGSMFSSYTGGVTIDGLYLAGSMSDASMSNLMNGVGVMLGAKSKLLNSEITNCDIGIMLQGEGSLVQGNYIHDLYISVDAAPGVDPNAVGGAEGIFINGSNNEIAYNSFVGCRASAQWTGGSCDGGATEVTVGAGKTVSGVKVHHNFAYQSCGFFEVSSGGGGTKGKFVDSAFYDNVSVDSGWLMLLQVNNTDMSNIRWENNTIVQRKGSLNAGMLVTVFTGTSSGVSGGSLGPGLVSMTNNLVVFDGVNVYGTPIDANVTQTTNLIIDTAKQDPGLKNLQGTAAADFDLVSGSPAIDKGTSVADVTLDYLNRSVPDTSGLPDIGAFEYNGTQTSAGGALAFGGAATTATPIAASGGAAVASGVGGRGGVVGPGAAGRAGIGTNLAMGGQLASSPNARPNTGGKPPTAPSMVAGSGGQSSAQPPVAPNASAGAPTSTSEPSRPGDGTQPKENSPLPAAGSATATPTPRQATEAGASAMNSTVHDQPGCGCRVAGPAYEHGANAAIAAMLGLGLFGRRRRRS